VENTCSAQPHSTHSRVPGCSAAITDRITFRCTLIQTDTESYRYQATAAEHAKQGA
jgi:hypothetical protein